MNSRGGRDQVRQTNDSGGNRGAGQSGSRERFTGQGGGRRAQRGTGAGSDAGRGNAANAGRPMRTGGNGLSEEAGFQAGTSVRVKVDREVPPNGYYLTDGRQDVLMHYSEKTRDIEIDEELDVFLFHDTNDRLAATMRTPLIRLGEMALLEVADLNPKLGAFLQIGLGRNLLLPRTELPEMEALRPRPGDQVYVVMTHDKQGRMIARLAKEMDFKPKVVPAPESWKNMKVMARVYKSLKIGAFVICDAGVLGFIHQEERTRQLRLGEELEVRVVFVREDGTVNLSMRPPKEIGMQDDAERILAFLQARPNGTMPYSDETPPEIIREKFGISKAAFKRAVGKLMKERLVEQAGNWTRLTEAGTASAQD